MLAPEGFLKHRFLSFVSKCHIHRVWDGTTVYISNKFPGDSDPVDPEIHFDNPCLS